ncbi:hypothetical protein BDZ91DRAFT_796926 [Kalaharituber pfeilii]|nr:hypothetical protein BDZ91DRAFT_796926 [Kalaharituber pfeilii]
MAYKGEYGAQMYEMFMQTHFNRQSSHQHMLQYLISTNLGQSGSPVLKNVPGQELTPIAVHTYGSASRRINLATTIDDVDDFRNPINDYISVFNPNTTWTSITVPGLNPPGVEFSKFPDSVSRVWKL